MSLVLSLCTLVFIRMIRTMRQGQGRDREVDLALAHPEPNLSWGCGVNQLPLVLNLYPGLRNAPCAGGPGVLVESGLTHEMRGHRKFPGRWACSSWGAGHIAEGGSSAGATLEQPGLLRDSGVGRTRVQAGPGPVAGPLITRLCFCFFHRSWSPAPLIPTITCPRRLWPSIWYPVGCENWATRRKRRYSA